MQAEFGSHGTSKPLVSCLLWELEVQQCRKQPFWKSVELQKFGDLVFLFKVIFLEVSVKIFHSDSAFPVQWHFFFPYKSLIPSYFYLLDLGCNRKISLLSILMEKVIRLTWFVHRTLFEDRDLSKNSLRTLLWVVQKLELLTALVITYLVYFIHLKMIL